MDRFLETFFNPTQIAATWPAILKGAVITVEVAFLVIVSGLALGFGLAVLRWLTGRWFSVLLMAFVDLFRSVPPLVLVLLVYFGLPNIGIEFSSFAVLWLVLTLVLTAFVEEIIWAGLISVKRGQREAARSTGLTEVQALSYVVFPQALRLSIPPLTNRTIAITKNTALGTVIGVPEIINQATTAVSFSGNATPLMMGAFAYLLLFIPVIGFGRWVEGRFAWRRH
ncbi:amino acid ABC transporter permease [Bradyrhizobium sp. LTSP857]|uniref:amino acid ABC transporter permease n=1 Tax=Bradyrhizobium sp. LTSP857 TaxID=1619231 RepID=UPI0005D152C4|nr:amino acid ABC transporter permease [Bradyrhizobium sp. LTSP857]KJC45209.1 polar amino acid ABC transporter permease [Bradyrhizobium sp. LTSP857]